MSTVTRPELSQKNKYWIERHRYYELKHFCLQYPIWEKAYAIAAFEQRKASALSVRNSNISKPTEECAIRCLYYSNRIELVKKTAKEANAELADYILTAVTQGLSYDLLRARTNIPCNKSAYYELYRRFFWLLDKNRA